MQLFKRFGLHADGAVHTAVYSVSMHPSGEHFATSGADAKIRIWSTASFQRIPSKGQEASESSLITILGKHTRVVTCVQWSANGFFLASGSDDTLIFLWSSTTTEDALTKNDNTLQWNRKSTLRGHTMDVVDLSWSMDSRFIASCSIDNKVIIWRIGDASSLTSKVLPPFRVLSGHKSWVKGVAWDPEGMYLASISDDKRVIIWRALDDWSIEAEIVEPFTDVTDQTFFLRLSWSADGSILGLPNAKKAQQHIASLVTRGAWNSNHADLFGHRHVITVIRFSSQFFKNANADMFNMVAIGSHDATVSIWSSSWKKPFVVFQDCFHGAVSDLCWSNDGNMLLASSHDGSICVFKWSSTDRNFGFSNSIQSGSSLEPAVPSIAKNTQIQSATDNTVSKPRYNNGHFAHQLTLSGMAVNNHDPMTKSFLNQSSAQKKSNFKESGVVCNVGISMNNRMHMGKTKSIQESSVFRYEGTFIHVECAIEISGFWLRARRKKRSIWSTFVTGHVSAFGSCDKFCAVGTADGIVQVFDNYCGSHILPKLLLRFPICHLVCKMCVEETCTRKINSDRLAALSSDGDVRMWDIYTFQLLLKCSVLPISTFIRSTSVLNMCEEIALNIHNDGRLFMRRTSEETNDTDLKMDETFYYDPHLGSWLLVKNDRMM